jgi:hypothetical protein
MGGENMPTTDSMRVQMQHLNEAMVSLSGKVDTLIDMTRAVAVLKVEADNHRNYTQQMEVRVTQTTAKLEAGLEAEESSRIHANKNIHGRIDVVRKWMFTVSGGGMVVLALLGYVGESIKGFAVAYMEAHDTSLKLQHDLESLKVQVEELHKPKMPPP